LSPIPQRPSPAERVLHPAPKLDDALNDDANAFLRTLTSRELAFFEGIRKFYGHGREASTTRSPQDVKNYQMLLARYAAEERNLSEKIDSWRKKKGFTKTLFFQANPSSKAYILSSLLYPGGEATRPWPSWSRAEFARLNL
jgi:hypothetical protein